MATKGTIRVLAGIVRPPLLETQDATVIEFRDNFGDLNAVFCRLVPDADLWAFVTRKDPDWDATLVRLGYKPSPITTQGLLAELSGTGS